MKAPLINISAPRRIVVNVSNGWARCYYRLLVGYLAIYTLQTIIDLARHQ